MNDAVHPPLVARVARIGEHGWRQDADRDIARA